MLLQSWKLLKVDRKKESDRDPASSARAGVIGVLVPIRDSAIEIPRVSQSAADLADQMVIRCRTFLLLCFLMCFDVG